MAQTSHDAVVSAQFGAQAGAYLASAVHAQGPDLDQLRELVGARPEALALDLGCGGGHVSFLLAQQVKQVTAYDLSAEMAATVNHEAARRGLKNLQAHQGSVESLPSGEAQFDLVASRYSAHHWHDVRAGLRQARRVLKPGGAAIFLDVFAPAAPLLDSWLQAFELLRDPSHVRNYSLDQWQALLTDAGFTPKLVSRFKLRLDFSSWIARMKTPEAHVQAIRSLQARADDGVKNYFAIEADGSFVIDTMLIAAEG